MTQTMGETVREVVLPSGRFASFRAIKWWDYAVSNNENPLVMLGELATRVVHIDGEPLTADQVLQMPLAEFLPIQEALAKMFGDAMGKKGAA